MARRRKTIEIREVKAKLNMQLANKELTKDQKSIIDGVLTDILMSTGNYNGFGFLQNEGPNAVEETPRPKDSTYFDRRYY